MPRASLTRRGFLAGLGIAAGGLALGIGRHGEAIAAPAADAASGGFAPNPFLHVGTDGIVTIVCHRSEMGQGVRSSLPVLIADELGADFAKVRVVQGDGDKRYGDQNTDGSTSVRKFYDDLRRVGATARTMLVAAAAKELRVRNSGLVARKHAVYDPRTRRSVGFGELAAAAARLPVPDPKKVVLRPRAELTRVGTDLPLVDGVDLVTGKARFGADVRVPGMLTAVVVRPPDVGGAVAGFDPAPALAVPGVRQVVALPAPTGAPAFQPLGGVAVIADHTWAALRGRAALDVRWTPGEHAGYDSASYRESLLAAVRAPGKVVRQVGDVDKALAAAATVVSAEYHVPHQAHATMEPPAALARVDGDRCEIWAPTQDPQTAQREVATALGLSPEQVTVHVTFLGGGFGRKSKPDFIVEAALLAKQAGAPVRVQWTRADDLRHAYYHTVSAQRLDAGLDARGAVTAWRHRTAFPSIGSTFQAGTVHAGPGELQQGVLDLPLAAPSVRAENGEAPAHLRIGWLRSVCNIHHAFAIGSFVDEIAAAQKRDPRETWLDVIGPARTFTAADAGVDKIPNYGQSLAEHPIDVGRLRHVIERVTERAGWAKGRAAGRALGLAAHRSFLSYVAVVAAASRDVRGKARIDEVWITADAGTILNADRVRAQMEGAVIFGMSIAFHGRITARGGAIEQRSFRDYPIVRIPEAPARIHVELIASDRPPGGVGEPGVPPVAPAIVNAIAALTGNRVRDLPLRRAGV
jgi:isoquinoline 1-oxidoreductase beta subunit